MKFPVCECELSKVICTGFLTKFGTAGLCHLGSRFTTVERLRDTKSGKTISGTDSKR